MKIVDPANPIPKYLQISTWLKEMIQSGRYQKGEKLPSEIELSKLCGVNRNTLRHGIAELVSMGLLRKEKGTGTFVSSVKTVALKHKLNKISSFSDDLKNNGIREKTILLKSQLETAHPLVAKVLILGVDKQVVALQRLRLGDDIPLIYEESYLPGHTYKNILHMDLTGSMYKTIDKHFKVVLARCEQTIRAVNLKGRIAELLNLPENRAGLFMESITYDENNIPIELLWSYYHGDKYIFEVELGRYHIRKGK